MVELNPPLWRPCVLQFEAVLLGDERREHLQE